jgi:hypothetical protein
MGYEYKVHLADDEWYERNGTEMPWCKFYYMGAVVTDVPSEVTCIPCRNKMEREGIGG